MCVCGVSVYGVGHVIHESGDLADDEEHDDRCQHDGDVVLARLPHVHVTSLTG